MTSCLKVFRIFSFEIPGDLILDPFGFLGFRWSRGFLE